MNKLLYLLFISIFLLDYLSLELGLLSRSITYLPELLSMITMLIILARVTVGLGGNFPPICGFFLFLFFTNIVIGVVINHVAAGPVIAGIRTYLKFFPFFILPFAYSFSNAQIAQQLKLLSFLFAIQAPVALYQRLIVSGGMVTGDYVRGTVGGSGQLTVILVCAIAILLSFYLAKKISLIHFIVLFSLFFMPMTMNETKVSLILLPMALILPIYFSSSDINLKQFIPLIGFIILVGIAFVFIYNHFVSSVAGYGITDFLSGEGRAERYIYKGTEFGSLEKVGRGDAIVIAYTILSENILDLLFGLGIGNVSLSFLPELSGAYAEKYRDYGVTGGSMTNFLWEIGLVGIISYLLLFFMAFKYSKLLSIKMQNSYIGTFSNGWKTVSILIAIGSTYTMVFSLNATSYLYWYFSGYIISENFR